MEQQPPSSSHFAANAFASMQFYRVGVKQVVGGTALAMASIAPTMALARYGQLKLHQLERSIHFN
jgi:hypothetical protein